MPPRRQSAQSSRTTDWLWNLTHALGGQEWGHKGGDKIVNSKAYDIDVVFGTEA